MTDRETRIFQDFVEKSSEIKESWEIVRLFEEEREKFRQDLANYEKEINHAKTTLSDIRSKILDLKNEIGILKTKKEEKVAQINLIKQDLFKQKIKKNISNLKHEKYQIVHDKKEEILPKPIETVDIYLKDGSIAKARPVKKVFSDILYKRYRIILRENKSLKEQILGFELENSKLKIEVRDFYTEDILRENEKSSDVNNMNIVNSEILIPEISVEKKKNLGVSELIPKKYISSDSKIDVYGVQVDQSLDDLSSTDSMKLQTSATRKK